MKAYSLWHALYMSFYSEAFYYDVYRRWKGLGLLYLLLLALIGGVATSWKTVTMYDTDTVTDLVMAEFFEYPGLSFEQNLNRLLDVVSQLPKITLNENSVSMEEDAPYFITDPASGKVLAILDMTGTYTTLQNTEAQLLLTRTRLILRKNKEVSSESEETGVGEDVTYLDEGKTHVQKDIDDTNRFLHMIAQFPKITLRNGVASIEETSPFYIYSKEDVPVIIIDMGGTYESLKDTKADVLLTPKAIYYRVGEKDEEASLAYSDITAEKMHYWVVRGIALLKKIAFVVFSLAFAVSYLSTLLLMGLCYAFIGWCISQLTFNGKFQYESLLRLAVVLMTPVFMLYLTLTVALHYQPSSLLLMGIAVGYMYLALVAINNGDAQQKGDKYGQP